MPARRLASCLLAAAAMLVGQVASAADTSALLDRALTLEQQAGGAAGDDIRIYVGNPLPDWEVLEVELHLEGLAARRYSYSPAENQAFGVGGLHRLATLSAATTPRKGLVEYFIHERNTKRATKPLRGRFDITLQAGAAQYLLQVQGRTLGDPQLIWSTAGDRAGRELRYADFLDGSGHAARAAFVRASYGDYGTRLANIAADPARIAQFNAALAAASPAALQPLAEAEPVDNLAWALRDRANLRLGYLQLRAGAPASAAEAFQRVRSPGPNSNAAMLGFGWARLIPPAAPKAAEMYLATTQLRPGDADAVAEARRTTPFRYVNAVARDNRAGDLRQALIPWGELIGRDPTDPAVQEGLLALAYAHGHLGAHQQADEYFRRAVAQLDALIDHYRQAEQDVAADGLARMWAQTTNADNGWPGWMTAMPEPRWWLTDPPNAPATFYFDGLLRNPDFLRDLDSLLSVRELQELLDSQAQRIAAQDQFALKSANAQLRSECEQLAGGYKANLRRLALAQLQQQRSGAEHYLAEASFALARMVDREDAGAGAGSLQ